MGFQRAALVSIAVFALISGFEPACALRAAENPRAAGKNGVVFAVSPNPNPPSTPVKLIFIHHSTGENWLNDDNGRLGVTLRDNNYFVSDTNYGWGPSDADVGDGTIGDHTDIGHWYNWFSGPHRDTYLNALYAESGQHCTYSRMAADPGGSNQIIMFKSCFPNSQLGGSTAVPVPPIEKNALRGEGSGSEAHTVANAKGIYIEILNYFATRQDKLFVVIAAPPLVRGDTDEATAANARAFNNWLLNEWLKSYPYANAFVFDFFNVLTSNGGPSRTDNPNLNDLGASDGNHHRWFGGAVQHLQSINNDFAAYASSSGDSHPTAAGGLKASGEFAALLNIAFNQWKAGASGCTLSCTASVPANALTESAVSFTATAAPNGCTGNASFDWDFGDGSVHSPQQNANHSYATSGTYTWTMTALVPGVTCTKTGTINIAARDTGCPQLPSVTDRTVYQVPDISEPQPHVRFKDSVFKTCIVRVTDRTKDVDPSDHSGGLKNEYSRVQSFNANETRILVRGTAATWYLYEAATLQPLGILPFEGAVDPRWDAADPNVLYYSEETRLMKYEVANRWQSLVHDFAADFPGQSLISIWTRYEGSPSLDGRYWGFMAQDQSEHVVAFLVYDQQADRVIAKRDMRGVAGVDDVDTVTISPLGNYYLAYFDACGEGKIGTDANPCGLMAYNRDLTNGRGLHLIMGHSDLALDAQGREVMICQDIDSDNIAMINLVDGTITNLSPIDFSHGEIGFHFSGQAHLLPGWAVVSTHVSSRTSYTWMDDQIFAMELKANGRIFRLAHAHTLVDPDQEHDYWAETQAGTNRDMTRVIFTSNWGRSGTDQVEMYQIDLPTGWASDKPAISLIFPRLLTNAESGTGLDHSEFTGLAFVNLGSTSAVLTLKGYDLTGTLIAGPSITNPRTIGLNPGQQLAKIDYQIFGDGLIAAKPVGWVALESSVRQIVGFFLMFNGSLTALDGADVSSSTATSFILPEVEDQGTTQIHVANPSGESAKVTFELYGTDGNSRSAAVVRTASARGGIAEFFSALFPGVTPATSDYIRVSSDKPVVGFECLGKIGQYSEGLNGQNTTGGGTVLYSPQYVIGSSWRSTLSIVNIDSTGGTVTMRFIKDDGTQIGDTKVEPIQAKGKIYISNQRYFVAAGDAQIQGYLEITSSGPRLAGSVVFGDPDRNQFAASLPLVSTPRSTMVFSQVVSDSNYFTGLAILNPNGSPANASIEVYDPSGNRVASKIEIIPAGRRSSGLLTDYFPILKDQNISGGYIKVTSDRNVASFALFGTTNLSVIAAVPPQAIP
jgi:PKD repeat protein